MTDTLSAEKKIAGCAPAYRTKLIEVALPLEAINAASAREMSIRHGHPSTLHLWWARRPLATCRAVLFAQMVDDPSAVPEEFPTEEAQEEERQRLFRIIENLVLWENSTREEILMPARREIARSLARNAGIGAPETDDDVWRMLREHAPPVLDPFCGGGSIPLEAQRLGLGAHGSDLNPVAVLITKALIEIPPKFADMPPVNPRDRGRCMGATWKGAAGLAADVRYYGEWMREQAFERIGHLYPKATLPDGGEATVIAWLWARTVKCPNPACGAQMPLVRSFALSTKQGKEVWVEPVVDRVEKSVRFEVKSVSGRVPDSPKVGRGANFRCLVCGGISDDQHIKDEALAGRMGQQLMAVVGEGSRGRTYLPPTSEQVRAALIDVRLVDVPTQPLANDPRNIWCVGYGLNTFDKLFTPRQLVALTTFSDLVGEARERALSDAREAGMADDGVPLHQGGRGTEAYGDAVATYLGFGVSRLSDICNSLCRWETSKTQVRNLFGRQAIPMVWDFAEPNLFAAAAGDFSVSLDNLVKVLERSKTGMPADARQMNASDTYDSRISAVISTDPPYYDNIGYADLSDFFYVWLRRSLRSVYPDLFRTMLVPKAEELIATPYRFAGDKRKAEAFFEHGLGTAFEQMHHAQDAQYPLTVYYAYKQAESQNGEEHAVSTGWDTMLSGLMRAGFEISGTWPMRSELSNRMIASGTNALASSIVLVCRPRPDSASIATRREFISALRAEMPLALKRLTHGNIAPVDLEQAVVGPGMRVFSRYDKVIEANGDRMPVRTALGLISRVRDEVMGEPESDYDPETRWAVTWFAHYGIGEGPYGDAETYSRAKNTSLNGLQAAGIVQARGGKVRLLRRDELPPDWNPLTDRRITVWEIAQHLIRVLQGDGEVEAAKLLRKVGGLGDAARDLSYALYLLADRKGLTDEAIAYNSLAVSWPSLAGVAARESPNEQTSLFGSE